MLKAAKPSPLNIKKLRKTKKKKVTILDLTTPPPPGHEQTDMNSNMETDMDSAPMTPICRSATPFPAPGPTPSPIPITASADPMPPPVWACTLSPDDQTPHTPSFPTLAMIAPPPPINPELTAIMSAIAGMRTDLLD